MTAVVVQQPAGGALHDAEKRVERREAAIEGSLRSAARELVQVGLFDRLALRGASCRSGGPVFCTDLEDDKIATKGRIGLQVHSGGPMEVRFRNFQLELNPKFELKTVKQ